jgi:hypothetical protein
LLMAQFSTTLEGQVAFFNALNKMLTEGTQYPFESKYRSLPNITASSIWKDTVPYAVDSTAADAFVTGNPTIGHKYTLKTLTAIPGSNNQAWYINDAGTFIKGWISPSDIPDPVTNDPSFGYQASLYTSSNTLIAPTQGRWNIFYAQGIVLFESGFTPMDMGWGTPKITCYNYIGGVGGVTGASNVGTGTGQVFKTNNAGILELRKILQGTNVTVTQVGDDIRIDATASGSTEYFFYPSAALEVGNVYKSWPNMLAAIAALPDGAIPKIIFRENFTIPTLGMPVGGWDIRLGSWESIIIATGAITITIPDGVIIKNLLEVGNGLLVDCQPTTADGMFVNTLLGGLTIIIEALGAKIANTGTKALVNASAQVVWVRNNSTNNVPPSSTGPLVKMNTADMILAIQFGESPNTIWENDWAIGGIAGSGIIYVHGVHFELPILTSWGGNPPFELNESKAKNLIYDDTLQSPSSGSSTTQGVIDWLKTQIGGAGGTSNTSIKTANYTAVSLNRVLVNTTGGSFNVTLPITPTANSLIDIVDVGGVCSTNPVTVLRNGENINGLASDLIFDVNGGKITLVYITSYGWKIV